MVMHVLIHFALITAPLCMTMRLFLTPPPSTINGDENQVEVDYRYLSRELAMVPLTALMLLFADGNNWQCRSAAEMLKTVFAVWLGAWYVVWSDAGMRISKSTSAIGAGEGGYWRVLPWHNPPSFP